MKSSRLALQKQETRRYETDSGAYQLVFRLEHDATIVIGALGSCGFPRGTYIYTGRASKGLGRRIERHLRTDKKLRWHIDYILQQARIEKILVYPGKATRECAINIETARILEGIFPIKGFGSSDCRCASHLMLVPETRIEKLKGIMGRKPRREQERS